MRLPVIATLTLATILSVGIAAPAYAADPVSYIDYSLDASDSQYTGGNFADGGVSTECTIAPGADLRYYTVEPFHVDVAGDYAPVDRVWTPTGGLLGDGALAIYTAAPDTADLEDSCLFGTDDGIGRTVALNVNTTYFLFQSTSAPATVGSFGFDVSGPGTIVLGAFVPAATTTTLSASAASVTVGTAVELTATVTGDSPTGNVEFFDGATSLGTAASAAGIATLTATTLAVGDHPITARYAGDERNAPSSATAITLTVTAAATPSVPPTTAPVAALAETGSDPFPAGLAALLLLAFGAAMLVTRMRRTGASD
ncbi:Ig-like domain-containing protein [Microterricola gilva]|nr:Ig-like domain-containing protein [Microterricola gilva]